MRLLRSFVASSSAFPVSVATAISALCPVSIASAGDGTFFILLDSRLAEQRIELQGIRAGEITYLDNLGKLQTTRLEENAALLPDWWSPRHRPADAFESPVAPALPASRAGLGSAAGGASGSGSTAGVIELVDGQRIGSRRTPDVSPNPEMVLWDTDYFGRLSVKLEAVKHIRFSQPRPVGAPGASGDIAAPGSAPKPVPGPSGNAAKNDTISLVNGDQLSGFIEQIGQVVVIESDGRKVETPAKQISEIRLVNESRQARGTRLWLVDGTVVDVARVGAETGATPPPAPSGSTGPGSPSTMLQVELMPDVWTRVELPPAIPAPTAQPDSGGKLAAPPKKNSSVKAPASSGTPGSSGSSASSGLSGGNGSVGGGGSVRLSHITALAPSVQNLASLASQPILRQRALADRLPGSEPIRLLWGGLDLDPRPSINILATKTAQVAAAASPGTSPPLGAADIEFPGPMTAEWGVPNGAVRFAGWVELPRECWTWGHCVVVISLTAESGSDAPVELFRQTLSGTSPIGEFNIALPARGAGTGNPVLRVTIEEGERGPIQDRVLLRRGLFLKAPAAKQ